MSFFLLCLATWRITRTLLKEDLPMNVLGGARDWLFKKHRATGQAPRGSLAYLFTCHFCMSLNVAIALSLVLGFGALEALAASAISIMIDFFAESLELEVHKRNAQISLLSMQANKLRMQQQTAAKPTTNETHIS